MKKILLVALWLTHECATAQNNFVAIAPADDEGTIIKKAAGVTPTPQQLRWQKLELTAFLHYGINTFTGREWGDGKENPALFNPANLDAAQWVKTMKGAGFGQVIITAKHHDGFCLWPTNTTAHSVKSSPWKNGKGDVVRDVAEACRKQKMGFGIYLSPWDRNAGVYGTDAYNDFFVQQLTELLTNYGRVDEVWFDGANGEGPNGKKQQYDFARWYALIRKLQPGAVIAIMGPDVRWVGTESGKGRETEWSVVPMNNLKQHAIAENSQQALAVKPEGYAKGDDLGGREKIMTAKGLVWYPAETDVSIRPGWFYHKEEDNEVKSATQLQSIYYTSVGMNSVLLLNVPPDKNGRIADADAKALREWAAMRNKIFSVNYLKNATVFSNNGINNAALADDNYYTYFTTRGADTSTVITFILKKPALINVISLQENIARGQRVERFSVWYSDKGKWVKATAGTTIGYKRLLKIKPVQTEKIQVVIESSRLNPAISAIGAYYDAGGL